MSKTNTSAEVMSARVRELIETGKSKGVLTYKEIIELLGDVELSPEQFDRILDTLSGLNIEVIKDEAIPEPELLNEVEEEEIDPLRHIILHCQITDEAMLKRIAADSLLVGVQPITLNYDMHMVDDRCGPELTATSYAYNTLEELGVHVAYGTDAPIDDLNPFPCLYTAVTRKDLSGWPEGGWHPKERVDIFRAVDAYTAGAAYQEFEEKRKGRIRPGFLCDLAVLDTDIFTADPFALRDTRGDMTIIGVEVVDRSNE